MTDPSDSANDFRQYIAGLSEGAFDDLLTEAIARLAQEWGPDSLLTVLLYHCEINRRTKDLKRNLMVEFRPEKGLLVFRAEVPPPQVGE